MPLNPWLERALVAWAAGAVASTVIVTTAKNPNQKKKRRKKKKKKQSGDGISVSVDDAVPRSTGAQAAHDYRLGVDRGMTPGELVDNVKSLGSKAKKAGTWISAGLFGTEVPVEKKPEEPTARAPDVVEDAKKALRDVVIDQAADKAGVAGVVDELKEQTARVVGGVRDAIPDDAGEKLKKAGAAVGDGAKRAGAAIKDTFTPEKIDAFEKKLDQRLKNIGRWFQGPGAPRDDDEPPPDDPPN
jgi:hypothetical protein